MCWPYLRILRVEKLVRNLGTYRKLAIVIYSLLFAVLAVEFH